MANIVSDIYEEITGKKLTALALGLMLVIGATWYYVATEKLSANQEMLHKLDKDNALMMEKLESYHKQILVLQLEVENLEAKVESLQKKIEELDRRDRDEFNKIMEKIYKKGK